jgi:hypothetical protein
MLNLDHFLSLFKKALFIDKPYEAMQGGGEYYPGFKTEKRPAAPLDQFNLTLRGLLARSQCAHEKINVDFQQY